MNQRLRSTCWGVLALLAQGCGGGGNDGPGPFQGRPATVEDLEGRSFRFAFVANGRPFDVSLGNVPTTLRFGAFDTPSTSPSAPFALETADGRVSGTAMFDNAAVTYTILTTDLDLPFTAGQAIVTEVQAEIGGGRISLTNSVTGLESTSDGKETPRITARPGDTLTSGTAEVISLSGTYRVPGGATSIRYRCTGGITVDIASSPPQSNTCSSPDGSQSVTNPIAGASEITFTFGPGAFATATID